MHGEGEHEGAHGHAEPGGPARAERELATAHGAHPAMEEDLRRRTLVCAALTLPVLLLSPTIQEFFGYQLVGFGGERLLLLALATVIVFYGGWPFFRGAWRSLAQRRADMDVLVSLAVLAGYAFSVASILAFQGVDFFWEISTLVVVLLLGHLLEMRAVRATGSALRQLASLIPPTAEMVHDEMTMEVPTAQLAVGDRVLVRPGARVPVDGEVYEGRSAVNEAMITGESRPVPKAPGDQVIGGTINGEGALRVRVSRTGQETALAQIVALVEGAQATRPKTQRLADRAANVLTLVAVGLGLFTFLFWYLVAGQAIVFALTLAITVIVIACPHALGLAIPTVTTIATSLAARSGILVRNAEALEGARQLDTILFDKTGTLTEGRFGLVELVPLAGWEADAALATAAAVEANSEHPIAQAIVEAARQRRLSIPEVQAFAALPGLGARAQVAGQTVLVGNRGLLVQEGIDPSPADRALAERRAPRTWIYLAVAGAVRALFGLADLIRPESRDAVRELKALGLEVAMITGDAQEVAADVAQELDLDTYFAQVLPRDKAARVQSLQASGRRVGMVGDGINDAPALVQADLGLAIGAGTDVAVESAQIVLVRNDPRDVTTLIRLSRATVHKMRQNLLWATGYNAIALPLAAGLLVPVGITLQPQWGALAMALSTVIVVLNALTLQRLRLRD